MRFLCAMFIFLSSKVGKKLHVGTSGLKYAQQIHWLHDMQTYIRSTSKTRAESRQSSTLHMQDVSNKALPNLKCVICRTLISYHDISCESNSYGFSPPK